MSEVLITSYTTGNYNCGNGFSAVYPASGSANGQALPMGSAPPNWYKLTRVIIRLYIAPQNGGGSATLKAVMYEASAQSGISMIPTGAPLETSAPVTVTNPEEDETFTAQFTFSGTHVYAAAKKYILVIECTALSGNNAAWSADANAAYSGNASALTSNWAPYTCSETTSGNFASFWFQLYGIADASPTPDTYTISASQNGSVSPSGTQTISSNTNVTTTPNPGYFLNYWLLDSVNVGSTNPYVIQYSGNGQTHTLEAIFLAYNASTQVLIGGTDYSSLIQHIELWLSETDITGRFLVNFFNGANVFGGNPNAPIQISKNNAPLMSGYVDQPICILMEDEQHECLSLAEYRGRDRAQTLQNVINGTVLSQAQVKADDLIATLFSQSGAAVSFTSPSTAPQILYEPEGKYLTDCIRDIFDLIDYSGYVDSNGVFHMFPHDGSGNQQASGIQLNCIFGNSSNNLIKYAERAYADALDLRNYIIVLLDLSSDDLFTEQNASVWATCSLVDTVNPSGGSQTTSNQPIDYEQSSPIAPSAGVASIECPESNGTFAGGQLNFPLYGINKIDYSQLTLPVNITFDLFAHDTTPNDHFQWWLSLKDDAGNWIGYTPNLPNLLTDGAAWNSISVPCGPTQLINPVGSYPKWVQLEGSGFSWKITAIRFTFDEPSNPTLQYVLIDNLQIPNVQPVAVAYWANQSPSDPDPTNINSPYTINGVTYPNGFGKRQLPITKSDFGAFFEASAYANSIYQKRKAPLEKITLWATGDCGFVSNAWAMLPGASVTLNVDKWGISSTSPNYRFVKIHHILDRETPESGWLHRVEVDLVPVAQKYQTQLWSYGKDQGGAAISRALRDRLTALEVTARQGNTWFANLP